MPSSSQEIARAFAQSTRTPMGRTTRQSVRITLAAGGLEPAKAAIRKYAELSIGVSALSCKKVADLIRTDADAHCPQDTGFLKESGYTETAGQHGFTSTSARMQTPSAARMMTGLGERPAGTFEWMLPGPKGGYRTYTEWLVGYLAEYAAFVHEGFVGKTHAPILNWTTPGTGDHWLSNAFEKYKGMLNKDLVEALHAGALLAGGAKTTTSSIAPRWEAR